MKIRNVFLSLLAIALIWACGKDDGPDTPVVTNTPPVIAAKTFTVPENIAAGTAIGTVTATDADKDALTFSISTNDSDLFAITKAGVLSLASGKSLSFATKAQHVITVAVSDGEASASAKVTINVTKVDPENLVPEIAAQQFTVSESIDDTFEIGVVQATDPDQDDLAFSIVTNDNDLFEITEAGSLTLAAGQSLDFGTAQEHTITVAVSDGNSSVNAEITIKVTQGDPNNQSPVIEPHEFSVVESIDDLYEIGIVEATDPEQDDMTFSISVNDNDLFEISVDGELSLAEGKQLDFDAAQEHVITVAVTDGNTVSKAEVTITVTEDPAPTGQPQEFGAQENIPDTEVIGTVVAEDPEGQSLTFSIVTNDSDLFEITEGGELSLAEGMTLDFETATQHNIVVGVSDGFNTTNLDVTIYVGDDTSLADDPTSFVTTWKTTMDGEGISIGTDVNFLYDYTIDWGDGTVEQLTAFNPSHQYENAGIHTVAIQGDFPAIRMFQNTSASKLMSIEQWGAIQWKTMERAFQDCENMVYHATDAPDLFSVSTMVFMFGGCSNFSGNLNSWDVGNISDMSSLFRESSFNGNISNWDISNVTNMNGMFLSSPFNGDIGNWDVSHVTNMGSLFYSNEVFNQDISAWDVSSVTIMGSMFYNAKAFNQDIGGWDTSNVTSMGLVFTYADSFNQDISGWDVSNVTKMNSMFRGSLAFNQDIGGWDVSSVTDMNKMFKDASAFDQDLGNWLVQDVTEMNEMFDNSGMSAQNYGNSLVGWASKAVAFNVTLGALNVNYCAGSQGEAARDFLINSKGWLISGDAPIVCP